MDAVSEKLLAKARLQAQSRDQLAERIERFFQSPEMRTLLDELKALIIQGIVELNITFDLPETERMEKEREYCRMLRTVTTMQDESLHMINAMHERRKRKLEAEAKAQ